MKVTILAQRSDP